MAARSLNKVLLIGNLTRDPEMRYTSSGTPVVTFGMATNKSWKDSEGDTKELAEFHNLVAWNKIAEICQQLLAKGMKVYIEGSLNPSSWEREDGVTKYKTEIRVDNMILLDSKGKDGVGLDDAEEPKEQEAEEPKEEEEEEPKEDSQGEDPLDDDLPF
ncbi:MAG: single-stranded DNA-binding protein [Candidatus Dojkabacteria bacterium]|nr:single-stranded DNA-binding protein [Candidatus Dojkabacteria bacterium]